MPLDIGSFRYAPVCEIPAAAHPDLMSCNRHPAGIVFDLRTDTCKILDPVCRRRAGFACVEGADKLSTTRPVRTYTHTTFADEYIRMGRNTTHGVLGK